MRAARLAVAVVLALAGVAAAGPIVVPPTGWKGGVDDALVHQTGALPHFGGVHGIVEAESYKPDKPGVVLDVVRVAATTSAHDAAARAEIDLLHPVPTSGERETDWHEAFDPATKLAEARMAMHDPSGQIGSTVRAVVAATAERVVIAKGECLAADDADPQLVKQCKAALETLETGVEEGDRVAIDLESGSGTGTGSGSGSTTSTGTSMGEGAHVPLAPISVPQEAPRTDWRPVFVGAGLILLALVFWWNRRRRARLEAENRDNRTNER